MKINHIGYLVKNMAKAYQSFHKLGFRQDFEVFDKDRSIFIKFISSDGYSIELIQPIDESSIIYKLLLKNGPTPYHICFETNNIQFSINQLSEDGFKVIIPLEKAIAFNNKKVVFLYSKLIGLIELVES